MKKCGLKTNKFKQIIASTICLVMLLGLVFQVTLFSAPEREKKKAEQAVTRVADKSTINSWQEFYGNEKNTSNAGKIWTDKTVVDGDITLESIDDTAATVIKRTDGSDNFMVGLSAISSNKSVTLEAAIPVDVMFVLDVSSSMKETPSKQRISLLIKAVNESIQTILDMNEKNKIGVVLYTGGNSEEQSSMQHAYCILPLDHYKTTERNQYLFVNTSASGNSQAIKVANGVFNSEDMPMYDENERGFAVTGNTYMQNGLLEAFEEFVPQSTGDTEGRIPVIALMGDGEPTAVNIQYADRGDATIEDRIGSTDGTDIRMAFLTQMTAAWIKKGLQEYYSKSPLFYTVGLFDDANVTENPYADMVFNPSESTNTDLDNWWDTFLVATPGKSVHLEAESKSIDVTKKDSKISKNEDRYYVDQFFNASSVKDLDAKFKELVERIKIQSAEFPTEEEENNPNYSGYLMFEDQIGEYMNVEHITGVMYDGELHQGNTFAKKMGKIEDVTEEEIKEFLFSIKERLGISTEQAYALWKNAREQGQISYSESKVSNYIAWYADKDGRYLVPYKCEEEVPEGAVFLNKSYFYYGNPSGTVAEEKLMYLGVRIEENLISNIEKVKFSVPASLVPLVKYKVSRNAANASDSQTQKEYTYPVRLFYEVGLKDGINEYDLSAVKSDYKYLNESDSKKEATFYSNAWIDNKEDAESQTSVQFDVSDKNEYYYYTEETPIYVKDAENSYKLYTGEKPNINDGNEYYCKKWIYSLENGAVESVFPIDKASLNVGKLTDGREGWAVLAGTFRYETLEEKSKSNQNNPNGNITETAEYIYKSTMQTNFSSYEGRKEENGLFTIWHGNNGKSVIQQGRLKIGKVVEGFFGEDNHETEFHFVLNLNSIDKTRVPTTINVKKNTGKYIHPIESGKVKFTLTDEENIDFWLPAGTNISLAEIGENEENYGTTITVNQEGQTLPKIEGKKVDNLEIITQSVSEINVSNGYIPPPQLLFLYKIDGDGRRLAGAKFDLYRLNCSDPDHHTDEVHNQIVKGTTDSECWKRISTAVSDDWEGYLNFLDERNESIEFTKGIYRLVEVEAPKEYMKSIGQWNIVVNPGTNKRVVFEEILGEQGERPTAIKKYTEKEFLIPNYKPLDPPITGGRGIDRFLILGAVVTVGGLMLTVHLVLQRRRGKL